LAETRLARGFRDAQAVRASFASIAAMYIRSHRNIADKTALRGLISAAANALDSTGVKRN